MPGRKKNKTVIAVCIQELSEDGSAMDLGAIKGDNLRFLHQAFITDTIVNTLRVREADIRLYSIDDPDRLRLVKIIGEYLTKKYADQPGTDLKARFSAHQLDRERWGLRIEKIFQDCFAAKYDNVLLIGSRTPTVTGSMIKSAVSMLEKSDAVFGPTPDGRYYMIGMSGSYRIQLSDFDWKSPSIYSEVVAAFEASGLSWSELEIWYAIESAEELDLLARDINQYRFEDDESSARETELVMERLIAKLGT